jgi:hypothetical protein
MDPPAKACRGSKQIGAFRTSEPRLSIIRSQAVRQFGQTRELWLRRNRPLQAVFRYPLSRQALGTRLNYKPSSGIVITDCLSARQPVVGYERLAGYGSRTRRLPLPCPRFPGTKRGAIRGCRTPCLVNIWIFIPIVRSVSSFLRGQLNWVAPSECPRENAPPQLRKCPLPGPSVRALRLFDLRSAGLGRSSCLHGRHGHNQYR